MKKYEWLNIDYILEKVNRHLSNHSYKLIVPDPAKGIYYKEGTFWLIDLFGEIRLKNIDLAEFGDGYNLFKSGELCGFEDFIANVCDGLLNSVALRNEALMIKPEIDIETPEKEATAGNNYEKVIKDCIFTKVNERLLKHGYELIDSGSGREESSGVKLPCLIDKSGTVLLEDVDIYKYGINLKCYSSSVVDLDFVIFNIFNGLTHIAQLELEIREEMRDNNFESN